jgi:hypothetical protein
MGRLDAIKKSIDVFEWQTHPERGHENKTLTGHLIDIIRTVTFDRCEHDILLHMEELNYCKE